MTVSGTSSSSASGSPIVRHLGLVDYETTWRAMQRFADERDPATADEIWLLEHPPVFTLGVNASRGDVLDPGNIPVVQVDRGGQATYHGPGQLVVYPLLDLRRHPLGVRPFVVALENAVIAFAASRGVTATGSREAPGVYVGAAKLASIGLRIRRGSSYHGLALNVSLDLEPFRRIIVCGRRGLAVTRLEDLCDVRDVNAAAREFIPYLVRALGLSVDPTAPAVAAPVAYSAINTNLQAVNSR